ncbi:Leucine-rich repeat-containing protein 43 [Desmophyllum pertusum]|uniref:Leucine-rich repeat-containing protein 43 n=1 Tax=Desmophyllum pertusum TaxID=174260 RepID=A0A9W9ZKN9_9CNID|nr:Leucine-rich repeat-containing protein 43 [Desmophyllum pertusum]
MSLTGASGCSVHAEEMEALFGGFDKTLPLCNLTFSGFSARGCLAPLTNSLHFFPDLIWLHLDKLNMDERDLRGLLESLRFIPNLETLNLSGNPLGLAVTSIVLHVNKVPKLYCLDIRQTGSEEELNYVRETIKQAKPKPHVSFILTGC